MAVATTALGAACEQCDECERAMNEGARRGGGHGAGGTKEGGLWGSGGKGMPIRTLLGAVVEIAHRAPRTEHARVDLHQRLLTREERGVDDVCNSTRIMQGLLSARGSEVYRMWQVEHRLISCLKVQ